MPAFNEDSRLAADALEEQQHSEGLDCGADAPGCRCQNKTLATALESGRFVVVERDLVDRLLAALRTNSNPLSAAQTSEALAAAKAAGFL